MIFFYGDSHAYHSFKDLSLPHGNYFQSNITMFRVGRDKSIPNWTPSHHDAESVICISYGEIDCRCHIQRQVDAGREEEVVIREVVDAYMDSIRHNLREYKAVIVVGVIPPTRRYDYESQHGPITHEFPFVGTDEDRVRYTTRMNQRLNERCQLEGFLYFQPYSYYTREDGTLRYELSDQTVHIGNNEVIREEFRRLYEAL